MTPRIQSICTLPGFKLVVVFDDGYRVIYDMYADLLTDAFDFLYIAPGLFHQARIDETRTRVVWNNDADISVWDIISQDLQNQLYRTTA